MLTIDSCEVCGNIELQEVLDLGLHPLCDDLIPLSSDQHCEEFPIKIVHCENCHTSHQLFQVPKEKLFTFDYHYRARMTGSVLKGMKSLVDSTEAFVGELKGKSVLDIGCNDGSLLDFFGKRGCTTVGVEPTAAALDATHDVVNGYFDHINAREIFSKYGKFDIVTFTNVFAHIENLDQLLKNVELVLKEAGTLVIENHYLGAVLDTGQFDTFYHEHPRTYSETSFHHIAKKLSRCVSKVDYVSRYGGNIRVFINNGSMKVLKKQESNFLHKYSLMREDLDNWKTSKLNEINNLVNKHGPLKAKAFPGRAAILIKLLELNTTHISAVYEITGSIKVDHFIPGTRIPILPEKELFKGDPAGPILNLAWHLPTEVRENLRLNGYNKKVIDIKDSSFAG